ncbi:MAG: 16S rRNA (uracil(1498)-N(3))-methyltransferase [Desulfobacterales bacterium]|nr:16S rRNA (uracil(1498)-N(3))-methyltransferase [Desulfobacterales bacterium]
MRRFYLHPDLIDSGDLVLDGANASHLRRVLRLGPGDAVVLFDGTGREFDARIDRFFGDRVTLRLTGQRDVRSESPLSITLAQGYLKEGKMDDLVRQSTELGVTRFVPFFADRSVARPDPGKLSARMKRWERIAREALKQCRRGRVPEIGPAAALDDIVGLSAGADLKIVFWEEAQIPLADISAALSAMPHEVFVLLGPEGGLGPEEVERLIAAGFVAAGLGPRILRAETATVAACALVQYLFGDLGGFHP